MERQSTIEALAKALHAQKTSSGHVARCPAHPDRNPSLVLREVNGKPLFKCFGGCSQETLIKKFLEMGVWPEQATVRLDPVVIMPRLVATYEYTDEESKVLYRIAKYTPKDFRPQRPTADGGWVNGYGDQRHVLYRLPEVMEAPIVFIVEGEKDVETLRSYGFVATTNAGGASGWREEFNPVFAGKEVHILPDNDPPGLKRATQIARGVLPYAASLDVIQLDGAKDVTEWFEAGNSELDLLTIVEGEEFART